MSRHSWFDRATTTGGILVYGRRDGSWGSRTYKHGRFHGLSLYERVGFLTQAVEGSGDTAYGEQDVQDLCGLALVCSSLPVLPHTIAPTMNASSQPKALTRRNRTKHRRHTEINEMPRKIVVTMKIDSLRPSRGNISQTVSRSLHDLYLSQFQFTFRERGRERERARQDH